MSRDNRFFKWMPGLKNLCEYQREWLPYDLKAGLSVAAVALPISIAYAELTGVGAIAGLYSTILPLIAYALFGTSRQLIVGPDTATCAVMSAAITPLAMSNPAQQWQLLIIMTFMIGLWCLLASRLRLGALSDLLSRPILVGLLNGVAITIIIDQFAKLMGIKYHSADFIERIFNLPQLMSTSHLPTLSISLIALLMLFLIKKLRPSWPAPLFTIIVITVCSWLLDIQQFGIKLLGNINAEGLSLSQWQNFQPGLMRDLVIPSLNIAVISFVSMMLTARSFATKNGYDIEGNSEIRALGIANIVSAFSQGFAVSGTSSRTAINDASGGKTQLVSIVAAVLIGIVVMFLLSPLQFIPVSVLGVVLVYAAWSLIDFRGIFQFRHRNRSAYHLSLFTFFCVLLIGIMPGIGLAVLLGLIQFLRTVFRPSEQLLGVSEEGRIHTLGNNKEIKPIPYTIMYRFNSPLTYFNIGYFRRRITNLVDGTLHGAKWVVIDAVACFTHPDVSVFQGIDDLTRDLKKRGVTLIIAGRQTDITRWFNEVRPATYTIDFVILSDLYLALKFIQSKVHAENVYRITRLNESSHQTNDERDLGEAINE